MVESLTPARVLFALAAVFLAYLIRGIAGFGSALVAVPLLALVMPLPLVVPAVGLLDYLGAVTHGLHYRRQVRWGDLLPLLPFTVVGVLAALYIFRTVEAQVLVKGLGVLVLGFAGYSLLPVTMPCGSRRWAAPAGGLGGLVGTLFGTGGPFYIIYFRLRQLDKGALRATVAMLFVMDGALRIAGYLVSGFYRRETLILVASGLPLFLGGMYLGGRIHTSLSPGQFMRLISLLLLVSGTALLLK